jgi:Tol biopolymer transport system component
VRLLPLLTNLAFASVARVLLPTTLAVGGERYLYYVMSLFFPLARCKTFQCFRFVPPTLASLLFMEPIDAFIVTGFVCHVLAGTMVWHIAERIDASRRVAFLSCVWFWIVWGPLPAMRDPLLIADPVQALWLTTALFLLLDRRYLAALPVLIVGAGVKESVLLVPLIYAVYLVLAREITRKDWAWLAVSIVAPIATWVIVRRYLMAAFAYAPPGDSSYLTHPYLTGLWLRSLGDWPRNLAVAAGYIFAGFGSGWIFGALGLAHATRRQRALTAAAAPAVMFLALYQEPHRAVACFSFAMAVPAAIYLAPLPSPLVAAVLIANAAFTVRMSAKLPWLPSLPVLLFVLLALTAWCVYLRVGRDSSPRDVRVVMPSSGFSGGRATATAVVALALLLIVVIGRDLVFARPLTRLTVAPPPAGIIADDDQGTPGLAVSADGERIVYVGRDGASARQLWLRPTRETTAEPIAGTDRADAPFWAPDGHAIGFFADDTLKTIDLATRGIRVLADAPEARGGAWGRRGVIVFASASGSALRQVAEGGGQIAGAIVERPPAGTSFGWPTFLPDGEHFLFAERITQSDQRWLRVGSIRSSESRRVMEDAYAPAYTPPGLVFFGRWHGLTAQPFDARRLVFAPFVIPVAGHIATAPGFSRAAVSVSEKVLAFAADTSTSSSRNDRSSTLRWYDRKGHWTALARDLGDTDTVDLSPDGQRVALSGHDMEGTWLWDLRRMTQWPLVPGRFRYAPVWSPDGTRLAVGARGTEPVNWQIQTVSANDAVDRHTTIWTGSTEATPVSWSPDGRVLLYVSDGGAAGDLWALALDREPKSVPLAPGSVRAGHSQFSPDGRWIAYAAENGDSRDVYVQSYPSTGQRWVVSINGGDQPRWRADGRELIYLSEHRFFMAVDIETQPTFRAGVPHRLFETRVAWRPNPAMFQYVISRDASRLLVDVIKGPEQSAPLNVIVNWKGMLGLVEP